MTAVRGTTNGNARGSATDRARRRAFLLATYAANVQVIQVEGTASSSVLHPDGPDHQARLMAYLESEGTGYALLATCRCYRCGCLLIDGTLTVDRIIPGCQGGTYRRDNIRPACGGCNSETGGALASKPKRPSTPRHTSTIQEN